MVEDLVLRQKAKDWFGAHAPGVVYVSLYIGPVGGGVTTGYVGRDDDGKAVAWVSLEEIERETKQPGVKPLLVLSYRQRLDKDTIEQMQASLRPVIDKGWACVVLDEMSRDGAQAFDASLPTLDTLSTDDIIEALASLVRVREATGEGDTRFNR